MSENDAYSFERHKGCQFFIQNSWMMSENKYMCEVAGDELLFVFEVPEKCMRGYKPYMLPTEPYKEPKEPLPKWNCQILQFKKKTHN